MKLILKIFILKKIDIEFGNFKDIEVDTIKSKVSIPETLKHKIIVPYDLTSSIGLKDNKIPKIYVESIFSDIIKYVLKLAF